MKYVLILAVWLIVLIIVVHALRIVVVLHAAGALVLLALACFVPYVVYRALVKRL